MFCNKCGNEIKDGDVFCSKCGNKIESANSGNKESIHKHLDTRNITKTFKGGFFPNKDRMAQQANTFLANGNFKFVGINFAISRGMVYSFTLNCEEITNEKSDYIFQIVRIRFGSIFGSNSPDKYITRWMDSHPNIKVVNQRIIDNNGLPFEAWLIYKFQRQ